MPLDPARVIDELRQLAEITSDENGAQRVAWTDTWARARGFMRERLSALPVDIEVDEAGNQWATLRGESERAVLLGGHIDSVPNGGWLDGSLNLLAGLEVLRHVAAEGIAPVTVRLVDWADEEGARFGRSLLGSSACAGSLLDLENVKSLRDRTGVELPRALAAYGIDIDRVSESARQLRTASAYLELHIEQGPVLESMALPLGSVLGTFGVERHRVTFRGQAAHAGSTPMPMRRDALAAAARFALEIREIAQRTGEGAVCTLGSVVTKPGIVTSVVEEAVCQLDQRHGAADRLASMLVAAREASERIASDEKVGVVWERIWSIEPIEFDETLITMCEAAIVETTGVSHRLRSGPLHDAAEIARAGVPTAMMFVQSLRGLSHTRLEDTRLEHLELAVRALDSLTSQTIEWIAAGGGREVSAAS